MSLAKNAAVAAHLLESHEELSAVVAHVHISSGSLVATDVQLQLRTRLDADALVTLAGCSHVMGAGQIELQPASGYVKARVSHEVTTPAGVAEVEVWTHLDVWTAQRMTSQFEVTLSKDAGPVFIDTAHVLRVLGAVA
ncbi:hypothetical protein [Saccharothrix deserti]|uniref:hypothetical protein n=1 Tax=Saccharothrix deserti TaxID=2593674 RepID=UPI00131E2EFC|nr:hypothetical protein [Saccharothrix deserti]